MSTTIVPSEHDHDPSMPPHNSAAEQAVLGAMMQSALVVGEVAELMTVDDLYVPRHARIFAAILAMADRGDPTTPISVSVELENRGELAGVGGTPYLHTCLAAIPTATMGAFYAEELAKLAVRRRVVRAGHSIAQLGQLPSGAADLANVLDQARKALDEAIDVRGSAAGYALVSEMRAARRAELEDLQAGRVPPALPTGLTDLDDLLDGGLRGGQLIVVAGRPGMGKSTLAMDCARHATVREGINAAIFSLEMPVAELYGRLVCAEGRVRYRDYRRPGALTSGALALVEEAADRLDQHGKLILDCTPNQTPTQIRAKAARIRAQHGLGLIVVDYLQLMSSGQRAESRQVEVSEMSRTLKVLALELDVPILALSQLNRGPEARADKTPMLSDLRESGALEQDADVVVLVNRPNFYDPDKRPGEADLIVAKHRGGQTGTVAVQTQLHYCRFANLHS